MTNKTIPWLSIKKEYLQGVTPKELGIKYKLTAKQISDKANKEGWVKEKAEISENVREKSKESIDRLTGIALSRLEDVLNNECTRTVDLINAIGKVLDISGLKKTEHNFESGNISITINRKPVKVERD